MWYPNSDTQEVALCPHGYVSSVNNTVGNPEPSGHRRGPQWWHQKLLGGDLGAGSNGKGDLCAKFSSDPQVFRR